MGKLLQAATVALAFGALSASARELTGDDYNRRHEADKAQAMLVSRILACPPGGNGWAKFERGDAFVLCGGLGDMQSARIECASGKVSPLNFTKLPEPTADSRKAVRELCALR